VEVEVVVLALQVLQEQVVLEVVEQVLTITVTVERQELQTLEAVVVEQET
jgi:hypothetical protein